MLPASHFQPRLRAFSACVQHQRAQSSPHQQSQVPGEKGGSPAGQAGLSREPARARCQQVEDAAGPGPGPHTHSAEGGTHVWLPTAASIKEYRVFTLSPQSYTSFGISVCVCVRTQYDDTQSQLSDLRQRYERTEQEKLSIHQELEQCKSSLKQLQDKTSSVSRSSPPVSSPLPPPALRPVRFLLSLPASSVNDLNGQVSTWSLGFVHSASFCLALN